MDQLARRSQRTVQQCGAGIRVEAARTEAGQTPYKPLQAYMDEASIEKHVQSWQQVLAFIARTQAAQASPSHDRDGDSQEDGDKGDGSGHGHGKWLGRLPAYGMTPRQRQKWQVLWQLAMPAIARPEAEAEAGGQARAQARARPGVRVIHTFAGAGQIIEDVWRASPSASTSPGSSSPAVMEMDEEMDDGDGVEAIDAEVEAWWMTPIEQACLEFYIELMNQCHRTHEYESALVCAMAVQGWGEARWRDPSSYPPILSRVLKVARFMVVRKALWLDPHAREIIRMWTGHQQPGGSGSSPVTWPLTSVDEQLVDIHPGDPAQGSPPSSGAGSGSGSGLGGKLFHDHVQQMVRSFMIRGTHGPMQTLLDWRTYGMKVDFNTTRPGHVGWMGSDELLYKDVHFTMGAFRGFVHGLVGSARELLREVLYISPPGTTTSSTSNSNTTTSFPPIPWSGLYDDPTQG
ncbi:hypothetical protein ASPCAL13412 [Aspergillus calidoustus]|uniref:Uncharacterized protein n=1 Tax=Aspergillus calidoustus TaxID=454130 RepID=A0A0U5GF04_ASPCI|nr:hypothetical protein ASPCAL13412 [Aspergillus calidoustus]